MLQVEAVLLAMSAHWVVVLGAGASLEMVRVNASASQTEALVLGPEVFSGGTSLGLPSVI